MCATFLLAAAQGLLLLDGALFYPELRESAVFMSNMVGMYIEERADEQSARLECSSMLLSNQWFAR